jgi:hypothetical protein
MDRMSAAEIEEGRLQRLAIAAVDHDRHLDSSNQRAAHAILTSLGSEHANTEILDLFEAEAITKNKTSAFFQLVFAE